MRAKRLRARIAGELKKRADKTTSPSVQRHLQRAYRAVFSPERKVPKGEVFVPSKILSPEGRGAVKSITDYLKKEKYFREVTSSKAANIIIPIVSVGVGVAVAKTVS